jgi:arsenate reductase (glutaredoxin)
MTIVLYGIPNCDTVKKARTWLTTEGVEHAFHDFKKAGLERATIEGWLRHVDWETLVNRKGTTWRNLSEASKAAVVDAESAIALMLESPSVIKRPVLVAASGIRVGFSADLYQQIFKK